MSTRLRDGNLSDLGAELDNLQGLGVDLIELSAFDFDLIIGGRLRQSQLKKILDICGGREVPYSVHGPLALNFMDIEDRLPKHFQLLEVFLDVAEALEAKHFVLHAGMTMENDPVRQRDAYLRQREWLFKAGDAAAARGLHLCVETLFEHDGWIHTPNPCQLAKELAAIDHSHVCATLDFGHSYIKLDAENRRGDLVAECAALAPYARHLHVHDCFGRQDDMWAYTDSERLALGLGDLHLPVGWGDIPWTKLMDACVFPAGAVMNIELNPRFSEDASECLKATRILSERIRTF
ncbi:sugar phosphate isomerase/epimerase family protein [Thalassovita aquimarina]